MFSLHHRPPGYAKTFHFKAVMSQIKKYWEGWKYVSCLVMLDSLRPPWTTRLLSAWNSPGKNTGVGCHSLLQGIFLTQESNPGLLHWRQILYCLSHQRSVCVFASVHSCAFTWFGMRRVNVIPNQIKARKCTPEAHAHTSAASFNTSRHTRDR